MVRRLVTEEPHVSESLLTEVRSISRPLRSPADLEPLYDRIAAARVVLLGEASHGTHEYYTWRAAVSERLIADHGFSFVAVEGDWPDCYQVNRFLRGYPGAAEDAREALKAFRRWPTWMWANEEVLDFLTRLRKLNDGRPADRRAGFYGLDVYSLWDSLYEVMRYLRRHVPEALPAARRALRCFQPYGEDPQQYAQATVLVPHSCEPEVVQLLKEVSARAAPDGRDGWDAQFVAEQNALVVKNAEAYYRAMVRTDAGSWNVRDRHMAETLERLLDHHGPDAKAIVWAHNTHVGDARFTDMADDGMVNLGQLARDRYGEREVMVVGFASYRGTVVAGDEWDAPWAEMMLPPGREGSWEEALHRAGAEDKLVTFQNPAGPALTAWRGHRAVGVVYRPQYERYGNYVPTVLPRRYDAVVYLDRTSALRPLVQPTDDDREPPETYPSGQ